VAATLTRFGLDGHLLTVFISGFMLTLIGLLRLGSLIRYIPHAVTVGFTCGIAVTIFASQLKDLGGLKLPGAEPGQLFPKLVVLGQALPTISPITLAVGTAALIFLVRRIAPTWPGMLIAVTLATLAAWLFQLPVETIGSHFGQLPSGVPTPKLPIFSTAAVLAVLPTALSFTLLGAVESLLSAKVADGMTGRKHRYNMEVVAQGIANVASALFGGISVTGTIARTATNIRAGAVSPVSGMAHAVFVLVFMLVASPLASFIPLSTLAGVLVVACWNMAEKEDFVRMLYGWRSASVLLATFGLTLLEDLTFGIIAGCVLAAAFAVFDRARR
jgi:SulP family sulfate permease